MLDTDGLTYADYARGGFWQLLVVTGLTLVVLAGAARWAPRDTRADRVADPGPARRARRCSPWSWSPPRSTG